MAGAAAAGSGNSVEVIQMNAPAGKLPNVITP
jgi:hypothetical protein